MKIILIILIYILITLIVTKIYFKQFDYFTTKYGYQCTPCDASHCEIGKYLDGCGGTNAGNCIGCPDNSTTTGLGSDSIEDCQCDRGFTGPNGGSCTMCESGKYKAIIGPSVCIGCPINSNSPEGSDSVTDCKCDRGFSGPDGGECTACLAGTYKTEIGSGSCQACEAGKYQSFPGQSQCESCASLCGADQYIVGCGGVDDGTCMDNWGVMSCGWNTNGQLGLDSTDSQKNTPTLIETYYNTISSTNYNYYSIVIDKISSGYYHTLFLTWDGYVYSCGKNDSGQLGFDSGSEAEDREHNDGRKRDSENNPYHIKPVLIRTFYNSSIKITEISAGQSHSLFLTSEGHVYSCGNNDKGQLGLDSTDLQKTPTLIEKYYDSEEPITYTTYTNIKITEISCGVVHSLFLTSEGSVYSCGNNKNGELGLGTSGEGKDKSRPTLINGLINITEISAGFYHSLFLTREGRVYSCGSNGYKQLGLGTTSIQPRPTLITTYSTNSESVNYDMIMITKISACYTHSLFLTWDGYVYGCGNNTMGQLGFDNPSLPSRPKLITKYYNNTVSVNYDMITITKISGGYLHSIFLTSDGRVYSCGSNSKGQLGLDTSGLSSNILRRPTLISDLSNVWKIACGYDHSLFIYVKLKVYSFGSNFLGRLGLDSNENKITTPSIIETYYDITSDTSQNYDTIMIKKISSGFGHSLFLTQTGLVYSCGYNDVGQLGFDSGNKKDDQDNTDGREWSNTGAYTGPYHTRPTLIKDISNVKEIACGYFHSVFITREGRVYSCGSNGSGQLGLGNTGEEITPRLISGLSNVTEISCGFYHTIFLTSEGRVYSCGSNYWGQLGLGSTTTITTPTLIETFYNSDSLPINYDRITITKISCGFFYSLFLSKEGHVYSCGINEYGELGFDSGSEAEGREHNHGPYWSYNKPYHIRPVLIRTYYDSDSLQITYTNIKITKISAGHYHSLFLTSEGSVYSCGSNSNGKLGLDSLDASIKTPRLISGLSNVRDISCGRYHNLFLTSEGRVYSCGKNDFGQLGLGTSGTDSNESSPTLITNVSNVREIACGYDHSIIICG
jgi:alpha-tubulin suppressor-like RCC1 family protein